MQAYYDDGRGRYGTGESYDYFYKYDEEDDPIQTSDDGLWTYALPGDGEEVELLRYNGNAIHVEVPSMVDGRKVTALDSTFDGFYELKSAVVPEGVTSIEGAFYGCEGLEQVILPDSLLYMPYGLNSCYSLQEVRIPPHVKDVSNAFMGTGLRHIAFPEGTEDISGAFAASECLLSAYIPASVRTMYEAFADCETLTRVILADGITEIGDYAFSDCTALKELTIPESVVKFGKKSVGIMEIREYVDKRKTGYRIKGYQNVPGFCIRGVAGSGAQAYAEQQGILFVPLDR